MSTRFSVRPIWQHPPSRVLRSALISRRHSRSRVSRIRRCASRSLRDHILREAPSEIFRRNTKWTSSWSTPPELRLSSPRGSSRCGWETAWCSSLATTELWRSFLSTWENGRVRRVGPVRRRDPAWTGDLAETGGPASSAGRGGEGKSGWEGAGPERRSGPGRRTGPERRSDTDGASGAGKRSGDEGSSPDKTVS